MKARPSVAQNVARLGDTANAADFFCKACKEEYELKSRKTVFKNKVLDGSYRTKCERLAASNNPNLFLLNYDLNELSVTNLLVIARNG
jgi:type II restriction enzyme